MANQSYQQLDTRLNGLQNELYGLAHAITWLMTRLSHTTPPAIIGAEPVKRTFLQLYQLDLQRIAREQELEKLTNLVEGVKEDEIIETTNPNIVTTD